MNCNYMNNLVVPVLIGVHMFNSMFNSDYFVWDSFVCFFGTVLSVHRLVQLKLTFYPLFVQLKLAFYPLFLLILN